MSARSRAKSLGGVILEEVEEGFQDVQEPEERGLGLADIERDFRERAIRIVVQRNDFFLPNLLEMMKSGRIDISPRYQRRLRWDQNKKARLIESFLVNVPVPPVFLYETEFAHYEVMDGQQRLSTIREFFENQFALTKLEMLKKLNGLRFHQLPVIVKAGLERRSLSAIVLLTESTASPEQSMELRQAVFERLNTGGVRLNAQEVRNCLQTGPFNDLLHKLARSNLFTTMWDIPAASPGEETQPSPRLASNPLYMSMADNQLVLRFFALRDPKLISKGMKNTLDTCMKGYAHAGPSVLVELESLFTRALRLSNEVFGAGAFRLPARGSAKRGKLSAPLYDAVMIAFSRHLDQETEIRARRDAIARATVEALGNEDFYALVVGRANTRQAIIDRARYMEQVIAAVLQASS